MKINKKFYNILLRKEYKYSIVPSLLNQNLIGGLTNDNANYTKDKLASNATSGVKSQLLNKADDKERNLQNKYLTVQFPITSEPFPPQLIYLNNLLFYCISNIESNIEYIKKNRDDVVNKITGAAIIHKLLESMYTENGTTGIVPNNYMDTIIKDCEKYIFTNMDKQVCKDFLNAISSFLYVPLQNILNLHADYTRSISELSKKVAYNAGSIKIQTSDIFSKIPLTLENYNVLKEHLHNTFSTNSDIELLKHIWGRDKQLLTVLYNFESSNIYQLTIAAYIMKCIEESFTAFISEFCRIFNTTYLHADVIASNSFYSKKFVHLYLDTILARYCKYTEHEDNIALKNNSGINLMTEENSDTINNYLTDSKYKGKLNEGLDIIYNLQQANRPLSSQYIDGTDIPKQSNTFTKRPKDYYVRKDPVPYGFYIDKRREDDNYNNSDNDSINEDEEEDNDNEYSNEDI